MKNGRFTPEEREQLAALPAVERVTATCINYSAQFKEECMRRYARGESPAAIFESVGLSSRIIGYKRIERAVYHWKGALLKDSLTTTGSPQARHSARCETLKREKRDAVARQRAIRARQAREHEAKLAKSRERAKTREQRLIEEQAREIEALRAQVKALKALGTLSRASKRAPKTTEKSERFETIHRLKKESPNFNVSAACGVLEVSRRGYYDWAAAADARAMREADDLAAKALIEAVFVSHGLKKGSRQVKDSLLRDQDVTMSRKKIQRIMRKYGIACRRKRKNPHRPIGQDGLPKAAPNLLGRQFRQGVAHKVLLTDITYHRCLEGFCHTSAVIDGETNEVLAHVTSLSLEERFVLDAFDKLKGIAFAKGALAHSGQGVHYTARAYREKLAELGLAQSMSRRACCWDNAGMESFFGRMKEQLGPTKTLSASEVMQKVSNYIDYYNNHRGQRRLGWLTPTEYAARLAA